MIGAASSSLERPTAGLPAVGALLGPLNPWGLVAVDAGKPIWANAQACALAGCADFDDLARRWCEFASWYRVAPRIAGSSGGIVDVTVSGRDMALRYEIHASPDTPGMQLVVLKDRHEISEHDAAIVLAGEARLTTLYASQTAHDVRGGASEARMALAAVDAVLKSSPGDAGADTQKMLASRIASAISGCERATTAVGAWSTDLGGAAVPDAEVDLREIARRLSSILLLPSMTRLITCEIEAGDVARMANGSERGLRNGLACLGLHLLERAAEGARFTFRFESAPGSHAIVLSVDALEDPGDPLDPDRTMLWIEDRALVPFYAGRLLLEAQGAKLSRHSAADGAGFCVTIPAARNQVQTGSEARPANGGGDTQ